MAKVKNKIDYDKIGHCVKCHKGIADYMSDGSFRWRGDAKDHDFILNNFSKLKTKICSRCLENVNSDDYPSIMASVFKGWERECRESSMSEIEQERYLSAARRLRIFADGNGELLIAGGATIVLPNTFTAGATIKSAEVNSNFTTIYNDYNGNITNANISASAGIVASKLVLSGIAQTVSYTAAAENWAKGADIASASTTDIGSATGNCVDVTGTVTITALGTVQAGTIRIVRFTGALILTYNATSLILPTAANITTANGDCAIFESLGSGNWKCVMYQRGDGTGLVGTSASGVTIQTVNTMNGAVATGTTAIPLDDTIPQITEGDEYMTRTITPGNASNLLKITVVTNWACTDTTGTTTALFVGVTANALAASQTRTDTSGKMTNTHFIHYMTAGGTSALTFRVRIGSTTGTVTFNGAASGRLFGGVTASSITIEEVKA